MGPLLESLWEYWFAKLDVVETNLCEFGGFFFRDSLQDVLHELNFVPLDAIGLKTVHLGAELLLRPTPDVLDAVEVWPVLDVPDDLDVVLVAVVFKSLGLRFLAVDPAIVQEDGNGLLLVAVV